MVKLGGCVHLRLIRAKSQDPQSTSGQEANETVALV